MACPLQKCLEVAELKCRVRNILLHRRKPVPARNFLLAIVLLGITVAIVAAMAGLPPVAAGAFWQHDPSARSSSQPGSASGASAAFRAGEKLEYRVSWAAFSNAASVELAVPERRDLFGWQTWHFRAAAHTIGSVRSLFTIDDQFDSYADVATFESHQYESHLNELGRTEEKVLRLVAQGQSPRAAGPYTIVAPSTLDPLGALYALRNVNWQQTPEFRAPVYDGKDLYEMDARRDAANEPVQVAAGSFSTSHVSLRLFEYQKEVPGIHFVVWLDNAGSHVPVLMRAEMPFGTFRVELTSAQ